MDCIGKVPSPEQRARLHDLLQTLYGMTRSLQDVLVQISAVKIPTQPSLEKIHASLDECQVCHVANVLCACIDVCVCACVCMCVHVCAFVCMCVYTCMYVGVCGREHTCACACERVIVCVCVCVCVCV